MKRIVLALSLLTLVACSKEEKPVDYVLFSGKITNKNNDKVVVSGTDFKKEIKVKEDGTFSDTLRIPKEGQFSYAIAPERSSFYIKNGDNINLTIDTKEFDETIAYTGKGAEKNNYLAKWFLENESFSQYYKLEPTAFLEKAKAFRAQADQNLEQIKDANFVAFAKKQNEYTYYSSLNGYMDRHMYANKLTTPIELPEGFLKDLEGIDYDNEADFLVYDAYKSLVLSSAYDKASELIKKDTTKSFAGHIIAVAKNSKSQAVKDELVKSLTFQINANTPDLDDVFNGIMAMSTDDAFKKEVKASYEKMKKLGKGKPSPDFVDYENYKGGTSSLADFKGKYVYIDVWATWCQPCIKEIPSLKAIEKEYHDKNIEFVSISVDRDKAHDTWKNMIEKKELSGVQLFADKSFRSSFVEEYAINGIPRFILIDPEGNIVNSDAPRPSSPALKTLLGTLAI